MIGWLDARLPRRRSLGGGGDQGPLLLAVGGAGGGVGGRGAGGAAGGGGDRAAGGVRQHVAGAAEPGVACGRGGGRAAAWVGRRGGRRCGISWGGIPASLDAAGVARAAIESLAENFADGVVAPAFWGLVLGLPGMAAYKAINTADSMIGHRTVRHLEFGWAAARLDDWVNLPASRLAALWIVLAAVLVPGADAGEAWRAVWRDAGRHRSPNAGWPEAAMAGALGLRLAGPRVYGGVRVEDAWMGDGVRRRRRERMWGGRCGCSGWPVRDAGGRW